MLLNLRRIFKSAQKTLQLFKKGLGIKEIAEKRNIKEPTVWSHFAKLIEYNQFSVWKLLPWEKIHRILSRIYSENDRLKDIRKRINNGVNFDEINCVLASVKSKNRKKNICYIVNGYKKTYCYRKCYFNQRQRKECYRKFYYFVSRNPSLEMKKKEFLGLFNNHMNICVLSEQEKRRSVSWKEFKEINHTVPLF